MKKLKLRKVKGRGFALPLARSLYPRASTAEADPQAKPGAPADAGVRAKAPAPAAADKRPLGKAIEENLEMLLEVLVLVFFINAFLLQAFAIPTPSMENNLLVGDHMLVDRIAYSHSLSKIDAAILPQVKIRRGMMVAFKSPPEIEARNMSRLFYVKRVIGLPGETIKIIGNKVHIDGRPIDEPYVNLTAPLTVSPDFPPASANAWPAEFPREFRNSVVMTELGPAYKVPDGHYFCLGDNRNLSADSRIWGPLPADYVIGKPWRNYWSTKTTTDAMLGKSAPARLKDFVLGFFTKTRWNRILKRF